MSYPINTQTTDQWQFFNAAYAVKLTGAISQLAGQPTAGILATFGDGWPWQSSIWGADETYLPQLLSLSRRFDALRIKSASVGQPCIVALNAIPLGESA